MTDERAMKINHGPSDRSLLVKTITVAKQRKNNPPARTPTAKLNLIAKRQEA